MYPKTAAFLVGALGLANTATADSPSKPSIQPALDLNRMNTDLFNALKPTHSNWDYWGAGYIPQGCKKIAQDNNYDPHDFTIFNVHYDDCGTSWIFCRHKDAPASEIDMIDQVGRMPVHMRQFIRHFAAIPDPHTGLAAYGQNDDITFVVKPTPMIILHEMSHSIDSHALPQYPAPFSSNSNWKNEYNKDQNTVSEYGRSSWQEDFAESGWVAVYDKVVPGGLGSARGDWNKIFHQYATYQGYVGDGIMLPGGTCTKRLQQSETVTMSNSKKLSTASMPSHAIDFEAAGIEQIPELESPISYPPQMKRE